ncbi:hypothetical protein CRE_29887 [Caenorhabditis remanei]|uniref:Uncharacterized protein n=1 Tax=Caenorhabditis remanei TaxID=31234 RepID=E3MM03_CAERE|nr:hypothetical protein CRE_29887 [Caenorhabditis remanei]
MDPMELKPLNSTMNEETSEESSVAHSESGLVTPRDTWGRKISGPVDRWYLVYIIFTMHGMGMLMSWNMFITIAPQYYHDYWFNNTNYQDSFMSIIGVTSQIPNVGVMILNTIVVMVGFMMLRVVIPLIVNCFLIAVIVILAIFVTPSPDTVTWFYVVTLIIIMAMNLANGIYQNSVYGIVADFPDNYINSLIIGNNLCGVFTSVLSILTILISPNDIELNALLYFSISLAFMIVCLFSLYFLVRLPFYQYHIAKGVEARAEESVDNPSLKQYWECFRMCWVQLFNNFYVYFVSLLIFPAMMTDSVYSDPTQGKTSVFGDNLFYPITTFLNFNLFAWIGSTLANYVQFPSAKYLWIGVVLRTVFIPYYLFCNYRPETRLWPVLFENEWWFSIGCTIMAMTCGYMSSLALIYTPVEVPARYQKLSGMLASIFLMLGILVGVASTPIAAWAVENIGNKKKT